MNEASKAIARRIHDVRFATRYFVGDGIDIGAGNDPVSLYAELFPGMRSLRAWDLPDGDAQLLAGVADESFDFVHSSHCLEHLRDPREALRHWFRVLKPGGHLICMVPDEDLYEQGRFPSTFNDDHKWTFTLWKARSWSARTINLFDLLQTLGAAAQPIKAELLDASFRFRLPRQDQTRTAIGESAIEFIVRKRPADEIAAGGRFAAAR
ncbi:methyltransferase domain-containing protein [Cupriavidus agavae]|uniref:Methyltransferase family protein n=1 Tax=Cupriavidus agavae TaxID=1001822 RepID=A0A4Q7S0E7_9BURK|nr:class I SAM-dependent methyltransferase [Cupriavidus agavae]RZT38472.1 methyltransferase family protein [Cupriavidus agavae]